jgi:hypothetical protein
MLSKRVSTDLYSLSFDIFRDKYELRDRIYPFRTDINSIGSGYRIVIFINRSPHSQFLNSIKLSSSVEYVAVVLEKRSENLVRDRSIPVRVLASHQPA